MYRCWDNSTNVGYPVHEQSVYPEPDGSYQCVRCGKTTSPAKPYIVQEYDADGHGSPSEMLHTSCHATLEEARAEIRRLLGVSRLSPQRKWSDDDDDIEAYHMLLASEPHSDGCGGYAISIQKEKVNDENN